MNLDKIAPALVAAQAELGGVVKDSKNPHFKSNYASLEAVMAEAKPVLNRHKIAIMQMPGALTDAGLDVTTMLLHESGQSIQGTLTIPLSKRDPQSAGSAITYASRYALMAMLGMPPVEDDGESAMIRGSSRDEPAPPAKAALLSTTEENRIAIGNKKAIAAYIDTFKFALGRCDYQSEVLTLWAEQADERKKLGITPDSEAGQTLVGLRKDRIEELGMQNEAAQVAGVP